MAGRVVMISEQEVKYGKTVASQSRSLKRRGKRATRSNASPAKKVEVHLAATELINEVLYIEAWGDFAK